MQPFLEALRKRPLLGDGAMGTLLFARGVEIGSCLEALVVEQPALIASIHADYAHAGADVITAHTFGANRLRLALYGLQDRVVEFNTQAVKLAQATSATSGRDFYVAGNVGPVGKRVRWEDLAERAIVAAAFDEQVRALVDAGVDLLLFETFSDVDELSLAVGIAKQVCELPVVASMSFGVDGLTLAGERVEDVTMRLVGCGADVLGANCSVGPMQMVETLGKLRDAAPRALLSVSPNAGLPEMTVDGQLHYPVHYPVDVEEFAAYMPHFLAMGANLVGGCCGTTPVYIAAMRAKMDVAG